MKTSPVAEYLTKKFLKWQMESGQIKTTTEFAQYLGISQSYLSMLMSGERQNIGADTADKIALKFGDEIYTITGLEPKDPTFNFIEANWGKIPAHEKERIAQIIAPYASPRKTIDEPDTGPLNSQSTP